MQIMTRIFFVICMILFVNVNACPTSLDGWTFKLENNDIVKQDIETVELCQAECLEAGEVSILSGYHID